MTRAKQPYRNYKLQMLIPLQLRDLKEETIFHPTVLLWKGLKTPYFINIAFRGYISWKHNINYSYNLSPTMSF